MKKIRPDRLALPVLELAPGRVRFISPTAIQGFLALDLIERVGPISRKRFRLKESQALEDLADLLGIATQPKFVGLNLAERCLMGDRHAIARRDAWKPPQHPIRRVSKGDWMFHPSEPSHYR